MTIKNTIRYVGRMAMAGLLALSCLAGTSNAQDLRARVENTDASGLNNTKTTLALGQNGTENFRAYNFTGDSGDYTAGALGNQYGTIFGTFGDKQGVGAELTPTLGNSKAILNAEHSDSTDITRLGAGLDQKIGNTTIGAAFDSIDTNKYGLAHVIVDLDANNQVGAGFRRNDANKDNSAIAFFCNYGPKEAWGSRTYGKVDWNDDNDKKVICFDTIIAQNPTLSAFSSPWIVNRDSAGGGMYNVSAVENSIAAERVPLNNRSKNGLVAEVSGAITEQAGEAKGNVRLDAGYTFSETHGVKPGVVVFFNQDISGAAKNKAGASAIATYKGLTLETTATRRLADDKTDFYTSLSYSKKF